MTTTSAPDPAAGATQDTGSGSQRARGGRGPAISLVMPAYNEEATLEAAVQRCLTVLERVTDDYELIILDDKSTDRTAEIMGELARRHPERIRALQHETNQGIATTFEDLYRAATREWVFLIPGDNQFPPEALDEIVPLLDRYDLIVCRRTSRPYTVWRHMLSFGFRFLPRLLFGVDVYDAGSNKCVRREIITDVPVDSKGVFVEAERMIRAAHRGYRIGTVDIAQELRQGGKAKGAAPAVIWEALRDMLAYWFRLRVLRSESAR